MMNAKKNDFDSLPKWYQMIFNNLLFVSFPGKDEIKLQLKNSKYEIIDRNGSLKIYPLLLVSAPVEKTIPIEAWAYDMDGVLIQILLYTRNGIVYMLEVLREDGKPVIKMPDANEFKIVKLGV